MKIKICGLKRLEDIEYVNLYKPDYIGFVFAGSKRKISFEFAKELKKHLSKDIITVGVFVDEDIKHITSLVNDKVIEMVQLHGSEDALYIKKLRKYIDVPIIKAIKVIDEKSLQINFDADYYLLDNAIAGSGESFDWKLIKKLDKPIFLAGGINLYNIKEALKQNVYALDISSGVETEGFKDRNKIEEIIRRVRHER